MSRRSEAASIDQAQRRLRLIWIAFMVAVGIYVFLGATVVAKSTEGEPPAMPVPVHLIFGLLALAEIVVYFLAPAFLLGESRLAQAISRGASSVSLPETAGSPADARNRALLALLAAYGNAMIVLWAVAESIAVYGLILTIVLRATTWLHPFAAVGFVLLALRPPRPERFVEENRRLLR